MSSLLSSEVSHVILMFLNFLKVPNRRRSVGNGCITCDIGQNTVSNFLVY